MLVLSRRIGEKICIGNGIVVTVVGARGGSVRLGIDAPPKVSVDRKEVRARKYAEREKHGVARLLAIHPR